VVSRVVTVGSLVVFIRVLLALRRISPSTLVSLSKPYSTN
jgi:hypothetical protein